ncbi:DMT family transporter [Pseudahrensia aquimaris]|uniref:DMT family transporter n=1 Tax=Pseudahrensia aquimaris TaxID=744461 RepID=A0ABW3FEM5_9HYPH
MQSSACPFPRRTLTLTPAQTLSIPFMPAIFKNPYLLLTITALFWGGNAIAGKFAIDHVSPMVLTFGRWAIALTIIGIIGRAHIANDWQKLKQRWFYLLMMGGFGYTAFNFALYSALHYTSAINITIEQTAMPFFIFVISFLVYRTSIQSLQIIGYALTVIGVIVTATNGTPLALLEGTSGLNRGDLIMLGGGIFYAAYSVGLRAKPDIHWQSFLASLIAGGVVFASFGLFYEMARGELLFPTTFQGAAVVAYAGIFPSLVSQGFFLAGVAAIGANRAGIFINLVPVFAAILSVMMLGEQLYPYHALAFCLVVGGVLIAQRGTR